MDEKIRALFAAFIDEGSKKMCVLAVGEQLPWGPYDKC
jgi:hypothetical protein